MAPQINKNINDKENLLNRLETGDSSGLDDFEKEALEGFASLENNELANKLSDSVTQKIEETYFPERDALRHKKNSENPFNEHGDINDNFEKVNQIKALTAYNFGIEETKTNKRYETAKCPCRQDEPHAASIF